jgi:hypothetical protein
MPAVATSRKRAQVTRVIALTTLTPLGLSGAPAHKPVHAQALDVLTFCYCA